MYGVDYIIFYIKTHIPTYTYTHVKYKLIFILIFLHYKSFSCCFFYSQPISVVLRPLNNSWILFSYSVFLVFIVILFFHLFLIFNTTGYNIVFLYFSYILLSFYSCFWFSPTFYYLFFKQKILMLSHNLTHSK